MKLKALSLAVGCAVAAFAGEVSALPLTSYSTASSSLDVIWASGSSALDPAIIRLAARACAVNTLDIYEASNEYVYFCQAASTVGLSKTYLQFTKYSGNGSYNGVVGVAEQSSFTYLDLSSLAQASNAGLCSTTVTTVASVAGVGGTDTGIPAYTIHSCSTTGATSSHVPDFGFSDLEVNVFASAADLTKLNGQVAVSQIFGVPLTIAARNALQVAQFGSGNACVGSDTLACMPSLSRLQIASMVDSSNSVLYWSQLGVPAGTLADDNIYIVRRTDVGSSGGHVQSGTQAAFEYFFTQELCTAGVSPYAAYSTTNSTDCAGSSTTASPLANFVMGGSGTSNLQACLQAHQAGGRAAIGMAGTLDTPTPNGTTDFGYRFIKVDGVAPTVDNVANGTYGLWVESSVNTRTGTNATGTEATKLANLFVADFGTASVLADTDRSLNSSYGTAGIASLASKAPTPAYATFPVTAAEVVNTPYNVYTHSPAGTTPNTCQPPILQQPQASS